MGMASERMCRGHHRVTEPGGEDQRRHGNRCRSGALLSGRACRSSTTDRWILAPWHPGRSGPARRLSEGFALRMPTEQSVFVLAHLVFRAPAAFGHPFDLSDEHMICRGRGTRERRWSAENCGSRSQQNEAQSRLQGHSVFLAGVRPCRSADGPSLVITKRRFGLECGRAVAFPVFGAGT